MKGWPISSEPTVEVGSGQVTLRQALIEEEVAELAAAAAVGDLTGIADALADIVYVAYGTAHVYGIDLDAVLDEVHASNMTKLDENGQTLWTGFLGFDEANGAGSTGGAGGGRK